MCNSRVIFKCSCNKVGAFLKCFSCMITLKRTLWYKAFHKFYQSHNSLCSSSTPTTKEKHESISGRQNASANRLPDLLKIQTAAWKKGKEKPSPLNLIFFFSFSHHYTWTSQCHHLSSFAAGVSFCVFKGGLLAASSLQF